MLFYIRCVYSSTLHPENVSLLDVLSSCGLLSSFCRKCRFVVQVDQILARRHRPSTSVYRHNSPFDSDRGLVCYALIHAVSPQVQPRPTALPSSIDVSIWPFCKLVGTPPPRYCWRMLAHLLPPLTPATPPMHLVCPYLSLTPLSPCCCLHVETQQPGKS